MEISEANYVDGIIAEFNRPDRRDLPIEALRAAQRHHEQITPRLIEIIRQAAAAVRADEKPVGDAYFFAPYLLTEFKAKDALPTILDAILLPIEAVDELFGVDFVSQYLPRTLAALGASTELLDGIIANRSLDLFVRWAAAAAYVHLLRDGLISRELVIDRLRQHLREATANEDEAAATFLTSELAELAAVDAIGDIEAAMKRDLVDVLFIDMDEVRTMLAEGEVQFQRRMDSLSPSGIDDTVAELSQWASFTPANELLDSEDLRQWPPSDEESPDDEEFDYLGYSAAVASELEDMSPRQEPIRNLNARIGRNDPCPCGSGRKFKKCCGSRH